MIGFPYVCKLFDIFEDGCNTYVVTSYANEGDIFKWLNQTIEPFAAREARLRPIVLQVIAAVRDLHNVGIAHNDISTENILLVDGKVRLIDFGMAGWDRYIKHVCGKPSYQAPEVHVGEYDSFMADVFAVGVVLFAMAYQDYPWLRTKPNQCRRFAYVQTHGFKALLAQRRVRKHQHLKLLGLFSDAFEDLVEALICLNPGGRMSLGENVFKDISRPAIVANPWFAGQDTIICTV